MKTKKILIVEDDEFCRGAMEKIFQSSGYETQGCVDGEDAVTCLDRECFVKSGTGSLFTKGLHRLN